ncbi:exo-beta-N-acetylmuramidase NamZ domain-containing protein [Alistipes ihumii]|mgnify:FL=1|uniref:exo-beta-N-acetylmuramidase NamZ family protein n=1 Tax=Alistipes ihumii TaxID=1470347 RepID=UPI003A89746A
MNRKIILLFGLLLASLGAPAQDRIETGAEQTGRYLPLLEGRRVGIMTNHTGTVGRTHLVDTLRSLGVDIRVVFAPEHGFRGQADAGESVASYRDRKTGIDVVSVYGSTKRPPDSIMQRLDVLLFDIQDVGLRYYTYLSSMHYLMEACAANGKRLIVLDRPNPNGFYVDGPVLEAKHRSFVGMHPIPVVHGMTLGELARMIDGEGWLRDGLRCKLTVIPCRGYTHRSRYRLPTAPSPNLPNMRAVYLYPSLCFFEGTPVSLGRGTDFPFQAYGHPELQGDFSFTPRSNAGAKNPPLKDKLCHGVDLRTAPSDERIWERGVDLGYVIDCYRQLNLGEKFFTPMFDRLIGTDYVRQMILQGAGADRIKARWADDVERFKQTRKPYLLYEE